ncbi:CobW family GTP-binding protein [Glaciimonas immobilis]|uniref:Cobalamin biosynthesis protein CobW n=1 Tax=Glaciimonas immobilis TaxID=728004 RepID=A0A840RTN3_9BURK|nr:GTP-binding protein [Glaciimonas immobilis]KAF3997058.1 GTP-binding protein [Glaciimonas immobilis]MBB5199910.1 cobalamin biosynthesis protein CobW [Glaciimonas immobilis]
MQSPIPVTIVTGFLGSGKTTLLSGLVKRRQRRRLALLINEFGEMAIDGVLMRDVADGDDHIRIHDFPHGLIAYGNDDSFIPAMLKIAERRANVDHVLIETSGLALPTGVMELLQGPELVATFVLDATLAVVDTPLLLADAFEHSATGDTTESVSNSIATVFDQQLAYADVVVLNKIDALDESALLEAESRVRARASNVRFLELAYNAQLDIRLALGLRLHQAKELAHNHTYAPVVQMPTSDSALLPHQSVLNGHAHSGMAAHSHGLATHKHFHEQDPGWMSFTLRSVSRQSVEKLKAAVTAASRSAPILRSKGFIRTSDSPKVWLLQGVRTRVTICEMAEGSAAPSTQASVQPSVQSELVFIGYHLRRAEVAEMLSNLTGTIWK